MIERAVALFADVDDTLLAIRDRDENLRRQSVASLNALNTAISAARQKSIAPWDFFMATGRSLLSLDRYAEEETALAASSALLSGKITDVGTAVHFRQPNGIFETDPNWPQGGAEGWHGAETHAAIRRVLNLRGLRPQPDDAQSECKVSFYVDCIDPIPHRGMPHSWRMRAQQYKA